MHHFPTRHQFLFDTVEELINLSSSGQTKDNKKSLNLIYDKILDTCCNNSVQKSVALLYLSWKTDNGDIVNLLIAKGADANTSDPDGRSCLHLSCCAGHPNNVESLLDAYLKVLLKVHLRFINLVFDVYSRYNRICSWVNAFF